MLFRSSIIFSNTNTTVGVNALQGASQQYNTAIGYGAGYSSVPTTPTFGTSSTVVANTSTGSGLATNIMQIGITPYNNTRTVACSSTGTVNIYYYSAGLASADTSFVTFASTSTAGGAAITSDGNTAIISVPWKGIYHYTWSGSTFSTQVQDSSNYSIPLNQIALSQDQKRIVVGDMSGGEIGRAHV